MIKYLAFAFILLFSCVTCHNDTNSTSSAPSTTDLCNGTALDPRRLYNTAQIQTIVTTCSTNCVINNPKLTLAQCDPPCLVANLSTSLACATCFANFANCSAVFCEFKCLNASSTLCVNCGRNSSCYPIYLACSGYSNDTTPPSFASKYIANLGLIYMALIVNFFIKNRL